MEHHYSFRGPDGEEWWAEWVSHETAARIATDFGLTAVLIWEMYET